MDAWVKHGFQRVAAPSLGMSKTRFKEEVAAVRSAMGCSGWRQMLAEWQEWSDVRPLPEAAAAVEEWKNASAKRVIEAGRRANRERQRQAQEGTIVEVAMLSRHPLDLAWAGVSS
ncbi:MAG: hypothetical protein ACRC1H_12600 [Caldilineaceae bacterium]